MMEAKDTITQTTEENCHNTLEKRLLEQAEISFNAGAREVIQDIVRMGYLIKDDDWQAIQKKYPKIKGG